MYNYSTFFHFQHANGKHISDSDRPSQPLLEPDRVKQNPPLAGQLHERTNNIQMSVNFGKR